MTHVKITLTQDRTRSTWRKYIHNTLLLMLEEGARRNLMGRLADLKDDVNCGHEAETPIVEWAKRKMGSGGCKA